MSAIINVWAGSLIANDIGPAIFEHFLPPALADDRSNAARDAIPHALERQRQGVCALKLVVRA